MADYRLSQSGDEVQEILNNSTPQADLNAETERAQQAEQQLQTNIDSEEQSRQQADTTLQQHIDSEAQTRQQDDTALRLFIQQVQGSLINYYLKTETYSANQIDQMLAAIKQFRYQVVDQLPTPSADTMGIIYLVPSAHAVSGNIKDEYITLTRDEGSGVIYYFEQIGETAIDLSNYYTKAQTNAEISAAINTAIANYYTKQEVDALIANFITKTVSDLTNYSLSECGRVADGISLHDGYYLSGAIHKSADAKRKRRVYYHQRNRSRYDHLLMGADRINRDRPEWVLHQPADRRGHRFCPRQLLNDRADVCCHRAGPSVVLYQAAGGCFDCQLHYGICGQSRELLPEE